MDQKNLDFLKELASEPNFQDYKRYMRNLLDVLDAERGCLWRGDDSEVVHCGDLSLNATFPFSRSVVDLVLKEGKGFVTFDPKNDDRLSPTCSVNMHNVRSCLCAATKDSDGLITAVAYFDNRMSAPPFKQEDLDFLTEAMSYLKL